MTDSEEVLSSITQKLGIDNIPPSWELHWESYVHWISQGECGKLTWKMPLHAVATFQLPVEIIQPLHKALSIVETNAELAELARLWHFLIFHLQENITSDNPDIWPLPRAELDCWSSLFPVLVLLSGTDHALNAFQEKGIPEEVIYSTLAVAGYYVRDYYRRNGVWGLAYLGWMRNHVKAKIFRLGRLTFNDLVYNWPFRALRHKLTGELLILCESSGKYRTDGLADGTSGIYDPDAWCPRLESNGNRLVGHRVSEDGVAMREPIELKLNEWEPILTPGNHVVEVHVPASDDGGKLLVDECLEAYTRSVGFFTQYYPQNEYRVFICLSWLLDPGLVHILGPESNIVRFQRMYHRLPVIGDERQAYDLVFQINHSDLAIAPRTTLLQRKMAEYVEAGNRMRSTAGFIHWDAVYDQC
jgi:hypothetical protein